MANHRILVWSVVCSRISAIWHVVDKDPIGQGVSGIPFALGLKTRI